MSWTNAYETKKFEARQKKQAEKYRALGMTEEQIKEMYEFDLEQFNSERRCREHTQALQVEEFEDVDADESDNALMKYFAEELTYTIDDSGEKSRYWWIEEIDDVELYKRLKALSVNDIELITLYVYEGYTHGEIAQIHSCTKQNIQRKFRRIKSFLS